MSVVKATGTANAQVPLLLRGGPREQLDFEYLAVENVRLSRENQHLREQWSEVVQTAEAIECDVHEVHHGAEPAPSALRPARAGARRAACAVVSCAGAGLLAWLGLAPLLCDIYGVGSGVDARVESAVGSVAVPRPSVHPMAVAAAEVEPDLAHAAKISIDQLMHSAFPGASYGHLKEWNPMFKDASYSRSPDCALVISYAPVPHGRTSPLPVASAYMDTSGLAVPYGDNIQSVMGLTELLGTYQHYQQRRHMESQNPYLVISSDIYGYAEEMHYQFVECALLGWPNVTGLSTGEFPLRVVVKNRQHGSPCRRHTASYAPCSLETSWGPNPGGGIWRSSAKELNELRHLCTTKYRCDIEQPQATQSHDKEAPQVFLLRAAGQAAPREAVVRKVDAPGANGRHGREDSCAAQGCTDYNVSLPCQCQDDCKLFDSCCSDYADVCGAAPGVRDPRPLNKAVGGILAMAGVTTPPPESCAMLGCVGYDETFACQCNHDCWRFGSCCNDYWAACKIKTSTVTTATSTSVTSSSTTRTTTTVTVSTSSTTTSATTVTTTTTTTSTLTLTTTTRTHTTVTVTRTTVTLTTIKPFVLRTPPPPHPPVPSWPALPGSRTGTRSRRPEAPDDASLLDKAERLVAFTAQSWTPWQSHV